MKRIVVSGLQKKVEKINRTVKRALDILQLIKGEGRPLTIKEISTAMEMPVSSTFDIVHTLESQGFLEYNEAESKAFTIGLGAFEIGSAYKLNQSILKIAHPYVEKLMQLTNATAFLAIADDHEILYLDKVEADTSVKTSAVLGSRKEMYCAGLGKAILACYNEEKIRGIFARSNVSAITEYTLTDIESLLKDIEHTRARGYAIDNREGNIDVLCIAHAILDYTGNPIAAISVATVYSAINETQIKRYGTIISQYANEISKKMGYLEDLRQSIN